MGIFLSLGYCLIFVRCSLLWFLAARVFAAFGGEEGSALAGQCSALPGRQEAAAGKGQNCFPTLFSRCAAFSLSSVFGVFLFLGLRRFFFAQTPLRRRRFVLPLMISLSFQVFCFPWLFLGVFVFFWWLGPSPLFGKTLPRGKRFALPGMSVWSLFLCFLSFSTVCFFAFLQFSPLLGKGGSATFSRCLLCSAGRACSP